MKDKIKKRQNKKSDYYLTLFKVKDHTTWRANLNSHKDGFEDMYKNPANPRPDITDRKDFRIDILTGEISQI